MRHHRNMTSFPLVMIDWVDSRQPVSTWRWLSSCEFQGVVKCQSVGWLIKDDNNIKVLAQNLGDLEGGDDMQVSGTIEIPTACVTGIKNLP